MTFSCTQFSIASMTFSENTSRSNSGSVQLWINNHQKCSVCCQFLLCTKIVNSINWRFGGIALKQFYFHAMLPCLKNLKLSKNFSWRSSPEILSAQSSFGGYGVEPLASQAYLAPHRQRLLLFRYSRMNHRNQSRYENLVRQPSAPSGTSNFARGASLDSPPVAPPRKFLVRKESQYQSMVDESVDDSDGSNMTSITTTTTGE